MCGDGTNDVGALKHAHVGVALISHSHPPQQPSNQTNAPESKAPSVSNNGDNRRSINDVLREQRERNMPRNRRPGLPPPPLAGAQAPAPNNALTRHQQRVTSAQERMQKMLAELEEQEKAAIVKLGDASIAAPFTSKLSSIQCSMCLHLIVFIVHSNDLFLFV